MGMCVLRASAHSRWSRTNLGYWPGNFEQKNPGGLQQTSTIGHPPDHLPPKPASALTLVCLTDSNQSKHIRNVFLTLKNGLGSCPATILPIFLIFYTFFALFCTKKGKNRRKQGENSDFPGKKPKTWSL